MDTRSALQEKIKGVLQDEMKKTIDSYCFVSFAKKGYTRELWTIVPNKLDNLDEMDKILETQNLPRLNPE